jgi:hypothetical protein
MLTAFAGAMERHFSVTEWSLLHTRVVRTRNRLLTGSSSNSPAKAVGTATLTTPTVANAATRIRHRRFITQRSPFGSVRIQIYPCLYRRAEK